MKAIILLLGSTFAYSCATQKEFQMDVIDVKLVKVETVNRYPYAEQKLLTWRDANNIDYVTFEPMNTNYPLGSLMKVMVKK
jgi:hypothetical protein